MPGDHGAIDLHRCCRREIIQGSCLHLHGESTLDTLPVGGIQFAIAINKFIDAAKGARSGAVVLATGERDIPEKLECQGQDCCPCQ